MKEKALTHFHKLIKKPCANQALALLMCAATLLGLMPAGALAASNENGSISSVSEPNPSVYTVDVGTELASVGLPADLEISVTTEENEPSVRREPVEWLGDYNKDIAGEYALTAAFTDETLAFSPMPTVRITVGEAASQPQDLLPAAGSLGAALGASDEEPPQLLGDGDVNQGVVCTLTPKKSAYKSGEAILFILNTQYADPGSASAPQRTVKIGISIPDTTPAVQLPLFSGLGTGEYAGIPKYTLSFSGITTDFYLVTLANGSRRIEYTLNAGDTVQGTLSMVLPNGVSAPMPDFTLTPAILSEGSYPTQTLTAGTTAIQAEFGWSDVRKTGSTGNLGIIGSGTKDPDSITYTITADSESSSISTGRVFTQNYVLGDTLVFNGVHYADGALTSSERGGVSSFFIAGNKVLEIAKPLSALTVEKTVSGGNITGFTIEYNAANTTLGRTDGRAAELANLNLSVKLLLSGMQLNPGNEDTSVVNTAQFDAYSHFYDAASGKTGEGYHHSSTASHTAYTSDKHSISKTAYEDAGCTRQLTQLADGQSVWYKIIAGNDGAWSGPFNIKDLMPAGMAYVSSTPNARVNGKTLSWSDISIASGSTYEILVEAAFDTAQFTANPMRNTAGLYRGEQLLAADYADTTYLSGTIDDSDIIYTKTVNKASVVQDDTLRYTVTAKNDTTTAPARLITITDKWPGASVRPTAITGCSDYELLDANDNSYTFAQVAADTSIVITTIKMHNVPVPAGGRAATVYIDGVVKAAVPEIKNEIIGSSGESRVEVYSTGISVAKGAFAFDAAAQTVGEALTNEVAVAADDIVCYRVTVKNLTAQPVSALSVVDKLPAGLSLSPQNYHGVSGSVLLYQGNAYTALAASAGTAQSAYTPYTTGSFSLAANETVYVYLFCSVGEAAITNSASNANKVTNAAYVMLQSGLATADATVNFYTVVDITQQFYIGKEIAFVADYDDQLKTASTQMLRRSDDLVQWGKNDIVYDGVYIGYRFQLINRNTGTNREPVLVYELIDTLPEGMEFVGVCVDGNLDSYTSSNPASLNNLGDKLIRDGETGDWSNAQYSAQAFTCRYDRAANQVHITFNGEDSGSLAVKYHQDGDSTSLKPFIYLVARVTDGAKQAKYRNTVEAKVDDTVELNPVTATAGIQEGSGADEGYRFISNYCDVGAVVMSPGIEKNLLGHYFGAAIPENVQNEDEIYLGEVLRYQLKVGVIPLTGKSANRGHFNLRNFVVTDILPEGFVYRANSTKLTLNALRIKATGAIDESTNAENPNRFARLIARGDAEPTVTTLDDGRTQLTWYFSGPDYRLFLSSGDAEYFLHLLTYDVEWDSANAATYGNYTNTAAVTHSYDFDSVYSGAPNYAENDVATTAVVNIFGAAGTAASKSVTNADRQTATGSQTENGGNQVAITPGETVRYSLSVMNAAANSEMNSVVIIDELPRATGDTGVVNRQGRGSEFNVSFGAAPNVSVMIQQGNAPSTAVDSSEYTVRYGMSSGGLNSTGDWSQAETGGRIIWGAASDGMNAIRIAFNPDYVFASNDTILVSFDAVAADADPGDIAWNSFGYTYRSKNLNDSTLSAKIYSEPQKVGIAVPGALINVTKQVSGDPAPAATEFGFALKQDGAALEDIKYTLSSDGETQRTAEGGSFTLKAGETATLYVGAGTGYTVEETLPVPEGYGFIAATPNAAADGTANGAVFSFRGLAVNDAVGAVYENSYTTPPTIDLSVRKVWDGAANPNQPREVEVQLYGNGVAEGSAAVLNAGNMWEHTWTELASITEWTVREITPLPEGYVSTVTGEQINGYTVTNTYTVPNTSVTVTKAWEGDTDPNRPMSVSVQLLGNGVPYLRPQALSGTNQWTYTWTQLDPTVIWTVREETVLSADYTTNITGNAAEGFVITNRYTVSKGTLVVSKTVTGDLGDRSKDFAFNIVFDAPGSYSYSGSKSGTIASGGTVLLRHDERITIAELPAGTTYSVTESGNSGYRVYASGDSGIIAANRSSTAAFTNSRSKTPNTGDDGSLFTALALMLGSLAGGAALLLADKRMKRRRRGTGTDR